MFYHFKLSITSTYQGHLYWNRRYRPKRKSQLSKHTSQTRAAIVRRMGKTSSEHAQHLVSEREYRSQACSRESSIKMSQRLANHRQNMSEIRDKECSTELLQRLIAAAHRQWTSRICNQSAPWSYWWAFYYDPNINYSKQSAVTIGASGKTCPKCFARKWSDEPNGMG